MKKPVIHSLFWYGLTLALLLILMRFIEYRYLVKTFSVDIYLGAIALIFTSLGVWISHQILRRRKKNGEIGEEIALETSQEILTDRESEVLLLMAEGHSNKEIAERLFISIHTVKTHTTNIFSKLGVRRRTQAISRARATGLIKAQNISGNRP